MDLITVTDLNCVTCSIFSSCSFFLFYILFCSLRPFVLLIPFDCIITVWFRCTRNEFNCKKDRCRIVFFRFVLTNWLFEDFIFFFFHSYNVTNVCLSGFFFYETVEFGCAPSLHFIIIDWIENILYFILFFWMSRACVNGFGNWEHCAYVFFFCCVFFLPLLVFPFWMAYAQRFIAQ